MNLIENSKAAGLIVVEGGVSAYEASRKLALPKSTLENWVRAFKAGKLGGIGGQQRSLTEIELVDPEKIKFYQAGCRLGNPSGFPKSAHKNSKTTSMNFISFLKFIPAATAVSQITS